MRSSLRLHDLLKRRFWASDPAREDRVTFGLYMAALDAEERAAGVYAGFVTRADKLPWGEDPPAEPLGGPVWGVYWPCLLPGTVASTPAVSESTHRVVRSRIS